MGEVVVAVFAFAALLGSGLLVTGLLRPQRWMMLAGAAVLLAVIGAWLVGLAGVVLAAAVLPFGIGRSKGRPPGA